MLATVLAILTAVVAMKRRALTRNGAVAASALGAACAIAGWGWVLLLLAFFISGTLLSRVREPAKLALTAGIIEKGSERDVWQVLANGGLFGAAAVGSLVAPSGAWQVIGAAAIAASTADTWATEVGILSSARPRSIPSGRVVAPGTSGGVTIIGTMAAVAGAGFIAILARLAGWNTLAPLAALVGGFTGSLVDSLIGGTVQSRRWCDQCVRETERVTHDCGTQTRPAGGIDWLTNDAVNAIGSLAGGATGALLLL